MAGGRVTQLAKTASIICLLTVAVMAMPAAAKEEGAAAKKTEQAAAPKIELEKATYSFGKVSQGEVIKHDFRVFNRGKGELEIKEVKPG